MDHEHDDGATPPGRTTDGTLPLPSPLADPPDVLRVAVGDREFVLVGTAHVSRESAELVREVIRREQPDHVCVELDDERYAVLVRSKAWEELDLRQVIRRKQLATLLVNLILASYQRRIGDRLGVLPGTELLEAVRAAEESGIPFSLCDRSVRTTLLRAWRSMSLWQRSKLFGWLVAGMLVSEELTEERLRELRSRDMLSEVLGELAREMPQLKRVLIDERDTYLSEKIRAAAGRRVVAVVGAGHVAGIGEALRSARPADLEPLSIIPPASPVLRWVGWSVPLAIVGSLGLVAWLKGGAIAGESLRYWILATGTPAALGALAALAHPVTIASAFVAAPITSLSPVLGAGHVTAFVQTYLVPPRVRDFHSMTTDAGVPAGWWRNRLLRVLLAFVFPTVGTLIGMWLGGAEIVSKLLS